VEEVLDEQTYFWDRLRAGERDAAVQVPCDGCVACCYAKRISVNPEKEPAERLAVLQTVKDRNGVRLRRRRDGACVHLGPEGCTVYEHRPTICRAFDCRETAIWGNRFISCGHSAPLWRFEGEDEDGGVVTHG
jgi:hypothetical protein